MLPLTQSELQFAGLDHKQLRSPDFRMSSKKSTNPNYAKTGESVAVSFYRKCFYGLAMVFCPTCSAVVFFNCSRHKSSAAGRFSEPAVMTRGVIKTINSSKSL